MARMLPLLLLFLGLATLGSSLSVTLSFKGRLHCENEALNGTSFSITAFEKDVVSADDCVVTNYTDSLGHFFITGTFEDGPINLMTGPDSEVEVYFRVDKKEICPENKEALFCGKNELLQPFTRAVEYSKSDERHLFDDAIFDVCDEGIWKHP